MAEILSSFPIAFLLIFAFSVWKRWQRRATNPNNLPLPPGPKSLPIIGNLLDLPSTFQWLTFDSWSKHYGDIIHISVLGQPMIILGSLEAATAFFEKKSAIHSSRNRMPMLVELLGWEWDFALMPYGENWRRHRRTFHQHFHSGAVAKYQHFQKRETCILLSRLLSDPEDFFHYIRLTFAASVMSLGYGIKVSEKNDPYVAAAEIAIGSLSETSVPGAFLVNQLPILKYVPAWFPGAGFQKKAVYWRQVAEEMVNKPFEVVKDALRRGTAGPSVAATMLQDLPAENQKEAEMVAKNCVAAAYAAGADTTVAAVQTFFLAMAMYPDVQKRAQAELDAVIGNARLPDFIDRANLPYIQAIALETLRWQPVTPLAFPHTSSADDEYNGYFIPKGSMVFGNAWSFLHDPVEYPDPEIFKPERFLKDGKLNPNIRDPHVAAFGFGRRICPGRFLSDNSMYSVISCTLAVFNIAPPLDEQGKPVQLKPEMLSGITSMPVPFKCDITPRSRVAVGLIRASQEDYIV